MLVPMPIPLRWRQIKRLSKMLAVRFRTIMIQTSSKRLMIGVAAGIGALFLAYFAHVHDRPVTAALVAVFGAVYVGALLGFKAGAVAGIVASIAYNLLFTDPVLRFSLSSADDLVPVIALNLSAIGSALVAGKLSDRAVAAEALSHQVKQLLQFSEDLQLAVTNGEVEDVARAYCLCAGEDLRLFIALNDELQPAKTSDWGSEIAQKLWADHSAELISDNQHAVTLKSGDLRLGALVVATKDQEGAGEWLDVFVPLITLAVQRCQLAEQLSEADLIKKSEQFKTVLLSSVSHDLRTPLAAITAASSSLAGFGTQLDDDAKSELLETIVEQCDRLNRLTTNLLNLGRIEGGLDVGLMPVIDAIEVLGSALSRVRRQTSNNTFERELNLQSALVRADPALLEQVYLNVLENAIVHTPCGSTIKVTTEGLKGQLLVAVQDDGRGIPVEEREQVFERFHQSRPTRGSGLGLSIARGFTELIGGRISAVDARDHFCGARIEITIPLMAQSS